MGRQIVGTSAGPRECGRAMEPIWHIRRRSHDRCPVCGIMLDGSLASIALTTPRGSQAWARCPACRSFFLDERYNLWQEVEHTRTRPWGMIQSGKALGDYKALLFETVLHILRKYAVQGSTLLDVGCSYGGFLQSARKEGYQVRGIEIVPEAVEYVRSQGITCDCAKSVSDLDVPENSQGVISVLDCNYYWPSQMTELRTLSSRLRPDGLLIVRVVDTSWVLRIGLSLGRWFPTAGQRLCTKAVYDHRVSIPVRSFLRIVQQEGFEIVYTSAWDAVPSRQSSLKVKSAYAIGHLVWRITGCSFAPGCVLLARKRAS